MGTLCSSPPLSTSTDCESLLSLWALRGLSVCSVVSWLSSFRVYRSSVDLWNSSERLVSESVSLGASLKYSASSWGYSSNLWVSESVSHGDSLELSAPSWGYSFELWVSGSTALSGSLELLAVSLLLPTKLEPCVCV